MRTHQHTSRHTPHARTTVLLACVLCLCLLASILPLAGCSKGPTTNVVESIAGQSAKLSLPPKTYDSYNAKDDSWAIYWYVCGSDIELREDLVYAATGQIQEMLEVALPENVTVVMQLGGAQKWHLNGIDPNLINRCVYQGNELRLVDTQPLTSMGDPYTYADFLNFCNTNYPAQHQAIIIYDHGGGSVGAIAYDHLFEMQSLKLPEMQEVMAARPAASGTYELVGLCACLMSSIDSVAAFNGTTKYLTASEEVELGCTWDHEKILRAIVDDPTIDGAALGKVIADGYLVQCEQAGYTAYTTSTTIDMAYADRLLEAYNDVGNELFEGVVAGGPEFAAAFGRAAFNSENYGAMNGPTSDVDMVDLGDLVTNAQELIPTTWQPMVSAIEQARAYHLTNPMRAIGHGISCYFPYTQNPDSLSAFMDLRTSPGWHYFYEYVMMEGKLSADAQAYLDSLARKKATPEPLPQPADLGLDNIGLVKNGAGYYMLELGDKAENVSAIYLEVGVYDRETADFWLIGTTRELYENWEYAIFGDQFSGSWICIDGQSCYAEAVALDEEQVLFRIPVLHNGVQKNLMVVLERPLYRSTREGGDYQILGLITPASNESSAASALYEPLKVGDVIEPILLYNKRYDSKGGVVTMLADEDLTWNPRNTITVTKDTRVYNQDVGPGTYMVRFRIVDYSGGIHLSKPGYYVRGPEGEMELVGLD